MPKTHAAPYYVSTFFAANNEVEEAYNTVSRGIQMVNAWLL